MLNLDRTDKRLVMVGGPFSSDTPEGCEANIVATEMLGIAVAEAGGAPTVPNSIGRSVMKTMTPGYAGSAGYEVWIDITLSILARSDAFVVTPSWMNSSGTRREVEAAFFFCVPVFFAKPSQNLGAPFYGYDIEMLREWLATPDHEIRVASPVTKRRLRTVAAGVRLLGEDAPVLPIIQRIEVVSDALKALQSVDDLGPEGNQKLFVYEQQLVAKYEQLKAA